MLWTVISGSKQDINEYTHAKNIYEREGGEHYIRMKFNHDRTISHPKNVFEYHKFKKGDHPPVGEVNDTHNRNDKASGFGNIPD